jgi:hypothetical protein
MIPYVTLILALTGIWILKSNGASKIYLVVYFGMVLFEYSLIGLLYEKKAGRIKSYV